MLRAALMAGGLLAGLVLAGISSLQAGDGELPAEVATPKLAVEKGLRFLAREVPAWPKENRCFSCHNNGDAARALFAAQRQGHEVPAAALPSTVDWLLKPAGWEHNGGEAEFSDPRLATVHFAAALVDAHVSQDRREQQEQQKLAIQQAARLVVAQQAADGSWPIDAAGTLGSPVTYGTVLATVTARRVLKATKSWEFVRARLNADGWLAGRTPQNVFDAAALLLWLADRDEKPDTVHERLREQCLALIGQGAQKSGGWGPFVNSRPEAFDTALVLLALAAQPKEGERGAEMQALIKAGRAYLANTQQADGSWPATTRPARGESYAQTMSTTGWVVQALLATQARPPLDVTESDRYK